LELVGGRLAARKRGCRVGKWAEGMGDEAGGTGEEDGEEARGGQRSWRVGYTDWRGRWRGKEEVGVAGEDVEAERETWRGERGGVVEEAGGVGGRSVWWNRRLKRNICSGKPRLEGRERMRCKVFFLNVPPKKFCINQQVCI
jgi:hypothetical protein